MIDTPFSIMDNRNTSATNVRVFVLPTPLIITDIYRIWQQQTINGQLLGNDNRLYRNRTDVYGAVTTNPAYIGNVSDGD